MKHCTSCGAAIRWVTMVSGKRMPVDESPTVDGNVIVNTLGVARVLTKDERATVDAMTPRYVSHFSTCPHSREHRRPNA